MDAATDTTVYERTLAIDASPETVWEFLVDPEKLMRWKGINADLDTEPGGIFRCEVIPGHIARGEYVEIDKPNKLVFTWGEPGDADAPVVTVSIRSAGELTRLTFELAGVDGEQGDDSFYDGWDQAIDALADHLDPAASVAG